MDKEQLIKDIVFVGVHWGSGREKDRERVNKKMTLLLETFPSCQHCNDETCDNKFWVIEEIKKGFLIKKYETNIFSVCSLKCLLNRGLSKDAYYSVIVRVANGDVLSTGFRGLNAMALNEFANKIKSQ
ncbi:hypothetical protein Dred_2579 [Desulforamulus reducens MI-1]|uniref:Uncharacterized protein n=1 Tax=Desulforamulus reducens (strain ATCC BAA-1160 / DSM 100696 / MI-1) TaxID=349161 RepID=A4J7N6_DESRM|nr:hypothetical protein [Desulforamulus reducens]ABO51089.1 hypothetical protein Dred_2579 [Desulforamulus reducens MI-1]